MPHPWLKIREFRSIFRAKSTELFTTVLVVLVGIGSFILGRMSALEENRPEVRILSASAVKGLEIVEGNGAGDAVLIPDIKEGGQVVASKTGTKYHLPWCSGAKSIKEENKIWFATYKEARAAGYLPASNCKGIE